MVLALGQERDGLSDAAISSADLSVAIDGTGNVESLNVSVATGCPAGGMVASEQGVIRLPECKKAS